MTTACVVLAGGRSRRLGRPKELVSIDGSTLLDRTLEACRHASPLVVAGPRRQGWSPAVVQVREEPVHGGPLAALAAAVPILESAGAEFVIVLACDMPRVAELIAALAPPEADLDAVVARDRGHVQPLAAVYRTSALFPALARGPVGGSSMFSLLAQLRWAWIDVADGCTDDVDTPADLHAWAGS